MITNIPLNVVDPAKLEPGVIAALFGALSAGLVTLFFKIGEWLFKRKALNKILKKGLYFEIYNHKIIELGADSDGQPNFSLESFHDSFYQNNLSEITRVLKDDIIQQLTFYYSHLKLAQDYQNELLELNEKIRAIEIRVISDEMKMDNLKKKRENIKNSIRLILAPSLFVRLKLLSELKKVFKEDPENLAFINVLPEHEEWFKSVQK